MKEADCVANSAPTDLSEKTSQILSKYNVVSKYSTSDILTASSLAAATNHHTTSIRQVISTSPLVQCDPMAWKSMSLLPKNCFSYEELKPQLSYIGLIAIAILSSKDVKLVLSDIYQFILNNYPYFRNRGPGWRNSVRHNLSLNDCFIKSDRSINGKGHYWTIHPANMDDFRNGDFRRRRAQRRVRKHMGFSTECESRGTPSPPLNVMLNSAELRQFQQSCAKEIRHYEIANKSLANVHGIDFTCSHYTQSNYNIQNRKALMPARTVYDVEDIVSSYDQKKSTKRQTIFTTFTNSAIENNLKLIYIPKFSCLNQPLAFSLKSILKQKSQENNLELTLPTLQSQLDQVKNHQMATSSYSPAANMVNGRKRQFDMASLLEPDCSQENLADERQAFELKLYENSSTSAELEDSDVDIITDDDESDKQKENDQIDVDAYTNRNRRCLGGIPLIDQTS